MKFHGVGDPTATAVGATPQASLAKAPGGIGAFGDVPRSGLGSKQALTVRCAQQPREGRNTKNKTLAYRADT